MTPTQPVDAFLSGIGASLKTPNSYDLILTKKCIFDVVHKYEMRIITAFAQTSGTLSREHQSSGYSGTYSESRQYTNLTSNTAMTQGPFSDMSTASHYTNLTSPGEMTHTQTLFSNTFKYHREHVHDNIPERLSHEKPNTLRSFFVNYQDK